MIPRKSFLQLRRRHLGEILSVRTLTCASSSMPCPTPSQVQIPCLSQWWCSEYHTAIERWWCRCCWLIITASRSSSKPIVGSYYYRYCSFNQLVPMVTLQRRHCSHDLRGGVGSGGRNDDFSNAPGGAKGVSDSRTVAVTNLLLETTAVHPSTTTSDETERRITDILDYYQTHPWNLSKLSSNNNNNTRHDTTTPTMTRNEWIKLLVGYSALCSNRIQESLPFASLMQLRWDILQYIESQHTNEAQSLQKRSTIPVVSDIEHLHQSVRTALSRRIHDQLEFRSMDSPHDWSQAVLTKSSVHRTLMHFNGEWVPRMFNDGRNGKRVFAFYHQSMDDPVAVLYVSLSLRIPASLREVLIVAPNDGDGVETSEASSTIAGAEKAMVATFYSIVADLQPVMTGIGLGEHLIHQAVQHLQQQQQREFIDCPGRVFVTLSPMPSFRSWLSTQADIMMTFQQPNSGSVANGWTGVYDSDDVQGTLQYLAHAWQCHVNEVLGTMILKLQQARDQSETNRTNDMSNGRIGGRNASRSQNPLQSAMDLLLLHMAKYYVCKAKRETAFLDSAPEDPKHGRQQRPLPVPLDRVTRFHMSNGAFMYRICLCADSSETGWTNSFGVMVNYRYDIAQLSERREAFRQTAVVPVWGSSDG